MKKVLYVLQGLGKGGVPSVVLNYLTELGHEIDADFAIIEQYSSTGAEENAVVRAGHVYQLPSFTKNMFSYYMALRKVIRDGKYDIVHDNNKYFGFLSLWAAKRCGVPMRIAHVHNTVVRKEKSLMHQVFIWITTMLTKKAANVLFACSVEAGRSMYGLDSFHVINNGIYPQSYKYDAHERKRMREKFQFDENDFIITMVARPDQLKRFDFAFIVFEQVRKKNENSHLLIAGAELDQVCERDRTQYNRLDHDTQKRIIFCGSTSDVPAILSMSDCFLMTSEHEGLGIAAIEAQANGLPCILSTGVPASVKTSDLVNFLPSLQAPELWAESILHSQTANREKYCDILVSSKFSIKNCAKKLKKLYGI